MEQSYNYFGLPTSRNQSKMQIIHPAAARNDPTDNYKRIIGHLIIAFSSNVFW
jgi:hypothetical protein